MVWPCWCRRSSSAIRMAAICSSFAAGAASLIKVLWHDGHGMCAIRQAAGTRPVHLAVERTGRWRGLHCDDDAGAARIYAGRDRLAATAAHVAADGGGMSVGRGLNATR